MKTANQSLLLVRNSLRIFWKSKVLVTQLVLLLIIGITILVTIIFSNYALSDSKNYYLKNGNLANYTINIPEKIRQESVNNNQETDSLLASQPGYTNIDKELQQKLNELKLHYNLTSTYKTSDLLSGNSFLVVNSNNDFGDGETGEVNSIVLEENSNELPKPMMNLEQIKTFGTIFNSYFRKITDKKYQNNQDTYNLFQYETYMQNKPWELVSYLVYYGIWHLNYEETLEYVESLIPMAQKPINQDWYNENINPFLNNTLGQQNKNSAWYKMSKQIKMKGFVYNGYGFTVDFLKQKGGTVQMPFSVEITDPSSYYSIISSNFLNANKSSKSFIPQNTYNDLINSNIPLKTYPSLEENPIYYTITNPDTGKPEKFTDLTSWMRSLDSKYKVQANSLEYVLIGAGMRPDMLYPVMDSNQLLVNSDNSAVLFTNTMGLNRMTQGVSDGISTYYSLKTTSNTPNDVLDLLQKYSLDKYQNITAYDLSDPNQPNHVIYLRANFLNQLQKIIFIITVIIAIIVGLLTLFFVTTLLRSIIRQNSVVLGICMANGISKQKLILSFFGFSLIPGVLASIISYICGVLLVGPMNSIYDSYWTLNIPETHFQWWLFIVIPLFTFAILFICNHFVMMFTLRKNAIITMSVGSEFKVNWFVLSTKWFTSKLPILGSLRFSFAFSNFFRLFILTFSVFAFISILSISVGTLNEFDNALTITNNSKKYNFAFDLYSPTIGGGYYSDMPYNEIGVSQMGLYNNYTSSGPTGGNYKTPEEVGTSADYGKKYSNALKFPYAENKYFTSMLLPTDKMASEFDNSIVFFDNKLFTRLTADFNLQVLSQKVNPWDMAKKILPKSLVSLADYYFQKMVQINFEFFYWLQEANSYSEQSIENIPMEYLFNNEPIKYSTYLPYITKQPWTIDGSDISKEYNPETDIKTWIFNKDTNPNTNELEWVINEKIIMPKLGLSMQVPAVQLLVLILTNEENPIYQHWYWNVYVNEHPELKKLDYIKSYDYRLAIGAVPVENNDETYTYLKSGINKINNVEEINKANVKILGIKLNTKFVSLLDKDGNDLSHLLIEGDDEYYPLIINEVVSKKYGIKQGDILEISTSNTFDRFNLINLGLDPSQISKFKVVGITNTKSEEQLFTTQEIANNILGYETFDDPQVVWNGMLSPGYGYIPFNGVFTTQKEPKLAFNYAGIYSPSGLSITHGAWNTNFGSGPGQITYSSQFAAVKNNIPNINNYTRINMVVNRNNANKVEQYQGMLNPIVTKTEGLNNDEVGDIVRKIVSIYGTTAPVVASMSSIDLPAANKLIGTKIDETILNVETVILITIIPTLFMIIMLIATIIIIEVRKLIAMLKIQGYSNFTSAFSFMFVYTIVLFLGIALSIPFTFGILSVFKTIVFTMFNIIVSPVAPIWVYIAALCAIALVFGLIFVYVLTKVKRLNLAQEISLR